MAFVREKGMFSFYEDGHTECCRVRKVKPLRRQLKTLTAWMTGQRKDQSPGTRQAVPVVQVDPVFEGSAGGPSSLVKFNPLANVTSAEVWHFLRVMGERFLPFFFFGFRERLFHLFCLFFCDRGGKKETHLISFLPSPRPPALCGKKNGPGVPINELHAQGYVSIGCEPCTKAVLPNQHERVGRWWWEDAKAKECGLHSGNVVQSAAEQAEKETARDLWADASSAVERLTRAQLEKASGSSKGDDDKATLVALYAPWCQYSQAAFRADEAAHRPFAESALGLETFPTVVMLPRGSKKAVKYDSEARDVESLEMFLRALGTTSE